MRGRYHILLGIAGAAGLAALMFVVVVGWENSLLPVARGVGPRAFSADEVAQAAPALVTPHGGLHVMHRELLAPDAQWLEDGHAMGNYDHILVEIHRDGMLRVLGEPMELDGLTALLENQRDELLQTMVSIRPDDQCRFTQIRPIIDACDQLRIPHRFVREPASAVSQAQISPDVPTFPTRA